MATIIVATNQFLNTRHQAPEPLNPSPKPLNPEAWNPYTLKALSSRVPLYGNPMETLQTTPSLRAHQVLAMSLLGIDAIAVELENPFGDKPHLGSRMGLESFGVLVFRV